MQVECVDFVEGAQKARGIAVVIDVFRAFTTSCYCFASGARSFLAVGSSERALSMREQYPETLLLGERYGKPLPGFDFGNSPSAVMNRDLTGRTVIHTTHAGTQGLVNATGAEQVLTGAFVNARATADYIISQRPLHVTLVRMGLHAETPCDEDWLYADYLAGLLRGESISERVIARKLKNSAFSQRFFDPAQPWSPEQDFHCCLEFNKFDFVLRAHAVDNDLCRLEMIHPQETP